MAQRLQAVAPLRFASLRHRLLIFLFCYALPLALCAKPPLPGGSPSALKGTFAFSLPLALCAKPPLQGGSPSALKGTFANSPPFMPSVPPSRSLRSHGSLYGRSSSAFSTVLTSSVPPSLRSCLVGCPSGLF